MRDRIESAIAFILFMATPAAGAVFYLVRYL